MLVADSAHPQRRVGGGGGGTPAAARTPAEARCCYSWLGSGLCGRALLLSTLATLARAPPSNTSLCIPSLCVAVGSGVAAPCGPMPDGCGSTLQCGNCTAGRRCTQGGGQSSSAQGTCQCGATTSCAAEGFNCGRLRTSPDPGCGTLTSCGSCAINHTCVANRCQCTPHSCTVAAALLGLPQPCGAMVDGCGGMLQCGACPPPPPGASGSGGGGGGGGGGGIGGGTAVGLTLLGMAAVGAGLLLLRRLCLRRRPAAPRAWGAGGADAVVALDGGGPASSLERRAALVMTSELNSLIRGGGGGGGGGEGEAQRWRPGVMRQFDADGNGTLDAAETSAMVAAVEARGREVLRRQQVMNIGYFTDALCPPLTSHGASIMLQ
jgi:hypothetical protein